MGTPFWGIQDEIAAGLRIVLLSPVEYLIAYLYMVERDRAAGWLVSHHMSQAGFSDDEITNAWLDARRAGLTRFSGLGQDRLSSVGRAKAPTLAAFVEKPETDK